MQTRLPLKKIPHTRLMLSALLGLTLFGCANVTPQNSTAATEVQIKAPQPGIVAYFSSEAWEISDEEAAVNGTLDKGQGYSATPVANGYYRQLIKTGSDGRFLVQDFYQNSQKKQTDPFWVKDPRGLTSFDSIFIDGSATAYFESGETKFKVTYKDLKAVGVHLSYYKNGQLKYKNNYEDQGIVMQNLWYSSGQAAAKLTRDSNNYHIVDVHAWDQQCQAITDEDEIDSLINQIYDAE